jgi:MFS family permease
MTFAVRGDILGTWGTEFSLNNQNIGWITGMAFWGFALSTIIGGAIVDFIGLKAMLVLAFATHVSGIIVTIFAGGFWTLFVGTAYPNQKTAKLNLFHVWFPGGIVIGGLAAYFLTTIGLGWQIKMAIILIPTLIYGAMFLGLRIPDTERVAAGISNSGMFREALKPMFLVLAFAMLLTASTELGTNQWLPEILTNTAAVSGILILVWINGLMAIGRTFAGQIVGKISPIGLLLGSAAASLVGLLLLSVANSAIFAFGAATIFAIGICYFWPTMLGVTSERFPAGGALLAGSTTPAAQPPPCARWRYCRSSCFSSSASSGSVTGPVAAIKQRTCLKERVSPASLKGQPPEGDGRLLDRLGLRTS